MARDITSPVTSYNATLPHHQTAEYNKHNISLCQRDRHPSSYLKATPAQIFTATKAVKKQKSNLMSNFFSLLQSIHLTLLVSVSTRLRFGKIFIHLSTKLQIPWIINNQETLCSTPKYWSVKKETTQFLRISWLYACLLFYWAGLTLSILGNELKPFRPLDRQDL